jgi:hypothetical protein
MTTATNTSASAYSEYSEEEKRRLRKRWDN